MSIGGFDEFFHFFCSIWTGNLVTNMASVRQRPHGWHQSNRRRMGEHEELGTSPNDPILFFVVSYAWSLSVGG